METRNRRANRLKAHDYSRAGGYFVTICAQGRINRFGDIVGGEMNMNEEGRIVAESWEWLGRQYDYVELDEWALMPNHLHGVLIIHDARAGGNIRRGGSRTAPTKPLGRSIGAFKTVSTKRINIYRDTPGTKLWQRSFHDRVIRDEADMSGIREYVRSNPLKWASDAYNPANRTEGRGARQGGRRDNPARAEFCLVGTGRDLPR